MRKVRVADDPRWDEDPSPSWNALAAAAGVALTSDLPEDPVRRELLVEVQLWWPRVPPELER